MLYRRNLPPIPAQRYRTASRDDIFRPRGNGLAIAEKSYPLANFIWAKPNPAMPAGMQPNPFYHY